MKRRVLAFLCVTVLVGWGAVAWAGNGGSDVPSVKRGHHQVVDLGHSKVVALQSLPEYQAVFGEVAPDAGTAAYVNFNGKQMLMGTFVRDRDIMTIQQDLKGTTVSIVHGVVDGQTLHMRDLVSGETNSVNLTDTPHGDLSDKVTESGELRLEWSDYDRCYWMCVIGCFGQYGPWCGPMCALACLGA